MCVENNQRTFSHLCFRENVGQSVSDARGASSGGGGAAGKLDSRRPTLRRYSGGLRTAPRTEVKTEAVVGE